MKSRSRTTLSHEGRYYLLVLAFIFGIAMFKEMNLLVLMAGMLLGPLVISYRVVALTSQGLKLRRQMPRGVSAGDSLVVSVELENSRRKTGCWGIRVEDEIHREGSPREELLRPSVWYPYVSAGTSAYQTYRGRLAQRGRYRFGPLTASTRFPFGLFERTVRIDSDEILTVYPRLGHLSSQWNRRHHEVVEGARHRERRHGRSTGEFFGVRQWRYGDNRRWIHWRSSARHGTLVVRQFEQHRNRDVAILVDLWQPERPESRHLAHVELAVSFAATLISEVCRQETSDLLLGLAAAEPIIVQGIATVGLRHESMDRLALIEASHADHLEALLQQAIVHVASGTEIVLVTTREIDWTAREEMAGLWRIATRRTMRGNIRIVNTSDEALSDYFRVEF